MTAQPTTRVRVRQFVRALEARRCPPDDGPAAEVLPPNLYALYRRMSPEDRLHGLEMLELLRAAGHRDPLLLQAGLLHDVGKADSPVGIRHRILRVLLVRRLPAVWRWLCRERGGRREAFYVIANHPEIGAQRLAEAGADPELVELVRFHESPAPADWADTSRAQRHAALTAVDARC